MPQISCLACCHKLHFLTSKHSNTLFIIFHGANKIKYPIKNPRKSIFSNHSQDTIRINKTVKHNIEKKYIDYRKSSVRSKVEHAFKIIKGKFGFNKVRYRGKSAFCLRKFTHVCPCQKVFNSHYGITPPFLGKEPYFLEVYSLIYGLISLICLKNSLISNLSYFITLFIQRFPGFCDWILNELKNVDIIVVEGNQ